MAITRSRTTVTRLSTIRKPNSSAFRRSAAVAQGTVNHPAQFRGRGAKNKRNTQQNESGGRAPKSPAPAITRSIYPPIPLYALKAQRILKRAGGVL